jgi:proteic killer suppression protein
MIGDFRYKGLELFFTTGSKAGIQPAHAAKLRRQLFVLDAASTPEDMDKPGWRLHGLSRKFSGNFAVWVNGNWRLTFMFEGENVVLVDYQDYH